MIRPSLLLASWLSCTWMIHALAAGEPAAAAPGAGDLQARAEQGDAASQIQLAVLYADGQGVEKDYEAAVKWFRKAADQGAAHAQYNLGIAYASGRGVDKDPAVAVQWYHKAASQGHAMAQYNLGVLHDAGEGVRKDPAEALQWYRKAADQGHAMAQFNVGAAYHNGDGVARDPVEAYAWINLAVRTLPERARFRDDLEKVLSGPQVAAAQRRTRELKSQIESRANPPQAPAPRPKAAAN